jgi:hypothetical protein
MRDRNVASEVQGIGNMGMALAMVQLQWSTLPIDKDFKIDGGCNSLPICTKLAWVGMAPACFWHLPELEDCCDALSTATRADDLRGELCE